MPPMGSPTNVRHVLAVSCLLTGCASSLPKQQDAARADVAADETSDTAPIVNINLDAMALRRDTGGEVGPLCQSIASPPYDAGASPYPLDWQSAQSMSSWCALYMDSHSELCVTQTNDGYNVAAIAYVIGGEMMIVDQTYFLYDPVTGRLVAELHAEVPISDLTCFFRTPDGPANPTFSPYICLGGLPLEPVCAPTRDAGSER